MKTVNRNEITDETYREILDVETHHDHEIILTESGVLRWKENIVVNELSERMSLNDLLPLFIALGHDKNSELYRKLYRDMGYSLFGYWEIFYWEVNNEDAHLYDPTA